MARWLGVTHGRRHTHCQPGFRRPRRLHTSGSVDAYDEPSPPGLRYRSRDAESQRISRDCSGSIQPAVVKISFDAFTLDLDTRQLTSGGRAIHLAPKAFELLTALVLERP